MYLISNQDSTVLRMATYSIHDAVVQRRLRLHQLNCPPEEDRGERCGDLLNDNEMSEKRSKEKMQLGIDRTKRLQWEVMVSERAPTEETVKYIGGADTAEPQ